jgi:hypothetical protein
LVRIGLAGANGYPEKGVAAECSGNNLTAHDFR